MKKLSDRFCLQKKIIKEYINRLKLSSENNELEKYHRKEKKFLTKKI